MVIHLIVVNIFHQKQNVPGGGATVGGRYHYLGTINVFIKRQLLRYFCLIHTICMDTFQPCAFKKEIFYILVI